MKINSTFSYAQDGREPLLTHCSSVNKWMPPIHTQQKCYKDRLEQIQADPDKSDFSGDCFLDMCMAESPTHSNYFCHIIYLVVQNKEVPFSFNRSVILSNMNFIK